MPDFLRQVETRLATLVALPSVSCVDRARDMSNLAVVDTLCQWYADAGFAIERQAVASAPAKVNMIARLGQGSGGLVLSGHTDTVPYDAGRWASDPFTLSERDGRWYGLGSADMKCFFPVVLAALDGLAPARLRAPVIVLATADEESTMAGARALSAADLGRQAIIGEPTELIPVRKHKGIIIGRVEVSGRSGHSSNPALGASALDCMHDILSAFKRWRATAASAHRDGDFKVPIPTMNFGSITGGDSPNRICASCELLFDVRLLPGMDTASTLRELDALVAECATATGVSASLTLPMQPLLPLETARNAAIVRAAEEFTGTSSAAVAFATEAPFFSALGCATVILGPGSIDSAHQPNEFVEIAQVTRMIPILRALIERFCCNA